MQFALLSYTSAAIAYGVLTVLLMLSRQRAEGRAHWLIFAAAGAMVWGVVVALSLTGESAASPPALAYSADALRTALWTNCLLAALPSVNGWRGAPKILAAATTVLGIVAAVTAWLDRGQATAQLALLCLSVTALLALEQMFRNSAPEQRSVLKPFLWTLAVVFCYDLFVFSDAALFGAVDQKLWSVRGFLAAVAASLLLLAAKRQPDWMRTLFISRQVVFYSATLTGVGTYLIAMAIVAAIIRENGGQWGAAIQLAFLAAALAILAMALASARLRMRARVFISKHFFRHRYEYRDEWLRLIRTLTASDSDLPLDQRCIKALADVVQSPGGQLWLNPGGPGDRYVPFAVWHAPFPTVELGADSGLIRFLADQQWIIDGPEYESDPERYGHAFVDVPPELLADSLIVPLIHQNRLLGLIRLARPAALGKLNYEDHDLLKTVGRQVVAFLAHDLAMEQLAETRQFEAYSKFSAFVMHDLKNLLAQQVLLVENAKKFQHRPEFVADVIHTIDNGVQRMRRLLRQLEQRSKSSPDQRVEVGALLGRAVETCAKAGPITLKSSLTSPVWVNAQPDRLTSVFTHVLVNAQEATAAGGTVDVLISEQSGFVVVQITDTGVGMSEEFVRRRLFKPFDTTKGTTGMGIGVYQARELVRASGGDFTVQSELGKGTTVRITLPLASVQSEVSPLSAARSQTSDTSELPQIGALGPVDADVGPEYPRPVRGAGHER